MQSSNRLSSCKAPPVQARPVASSDQQHQNHQHRHRHRQLSTAAVVTGARPPATSRCQQVKCVFVGDGAIGKTSLIVSYTTNGYPAEYVPTAFDTYSVVVTIDNKPCQLQLCDTAGQDDFDSIRPLCYKHTDVFMVCFSVVSPGSFASIRQKWLPEIRRSLQKQAAAAGTSADVNAIPPFILVGTQCDLRHDVKVLIELDAAGQQPISSDYARAMASKFGAMSYIECSALTQKNLKEVFDTAILAALDYRKQVKLAPPKSTPSIISANGCSSPLAAASRSPTILANNSSAGIADRSTAMVLKSTVAGGHSKHPKSTETSGHGAGHRGCPPPLPLSPHPQRHHFVPIERTKAAKISDARLVGWRKSLTKLSAQEALESEAAAAASPVADDYEFHYSSNTSSMASMALPLPPVQPVASTSFSTNCTTSGSPNYRTIVRSRRSNWSRAASNTTANATLLNSDADDDQGFHDDEEDEQEAEEDSAEEEEEEEECVSFDDQACLSGGPSNCHYYYHRAPTGQSSQQPPRAKYGPVGLHSGLKAGNGSQATYYYYRAPPPPVPSPPYNDPYRADYHYQQSSPSSALASRLLPPQPQPPVAASQRPQSKLQSFFNFSRPTSGNHNQKAVTGTSGGVFSGHQTNLNTTLRSSSFFFLASNNYKKTVDEKPAAKTKSKKAVSKSHSTSSSTNTCTTSSSSSSSTSSTMSNPLFKPANASNNNNGGLGSALYRSDIFQIMSNSVTELRNRKSLLKKFTLSSSGSSRSSSRRSSANSVTEKSKLKAKKLKELYYYDEDDYEEIESIGKRSSFRHKWCWCW